MAGQLTGPHGPSPYDTPRRRPFASTSAVSEAQRIEPLGGADAVPMTSATSTGPHAAAQMPTEATLSSEPPRVVVDAPGERMHQPLGRRVGLWFVALGAFLLGAQIIFALQGGFVIAPMAFLASWGLIVGLTMVLAPGPRVPHHERVAGTPNPGGIWGRLDRTHKTLWVGAMLIGVPIAGLIAWTLSELGMGVD